jgi:NitT/TauT family transport system ATP-binding protein
VPTTYPKCQPSEMMGLLVLLNSHKGSEDVALLADDLDLEIDEILPALEFAEILQLVKVSEGRATFTDLGKRLVAGSIRDRKTIIRDQLRRTTLFRTLLRALESAADHSLTDEQLNQIAAFTTAPADEAVQTIVNWGRYAELFRYDADERRLVAVRHPSGTKTGASRPPPPGGSTAATGSEVSGNRAARTTPASTQTETRPAPVVPVTA